MLNGSTFVRGSRLLIIFLAKFCHSVERWRISKMEDCVEQKAAVGAAAAAAAALACH
jgi:hypothetical protein